MENEKQEKLKEEEEEKPKETGEDNSKAVPNFTQMVERLEKANAEAKEIIAQQEELAARRLLSGESSGMVKEEIPKEETPQEYAKKVMSGEVSFK